MVNNHLRRLREPFQAGEHRRAHKLPRRQSHRKGRPHQKGKNHRFIPSKSKLAQMYLSSQQISYLDEALCFPFDQINLYATLYIYRDIYIYLFIHLNNPVALDEFRRGRGDSVWDVRLVDGRRNFSARQFPPQQTSRRTPNQPPCPPHR